uniref:Uncharacterized protein n=1 Tax=Octopus bimaculoides TaxID=37653 RepID=A0A0L8G5U5_OCTBM
MFLIIINISTLIHYGCADIPKIRMQLFWILSRLTNSSYFYLALIYKSISRSIHKVWCMNLNSNVRYFECKNFYSYHLYSNLELSLALSHAHIHTQTPITSC